MSQLILLASFVLLACTPDVPANPSFQQDILPILAANCIRCHGAPTLGGAPTDFRLDTFDDLAITEGESRPEPVCGGDLSDPAAEVVICGAKSKAGRIAVRIADEAQPMPPRFALDEFQIETLQKWAEGAERGAPREGNHVPSVTIEDTSRNGAFVTVRARIADVDRDLVTGSLRAQVGSTQHLVGVVRSGLVELTWDTTGIAPGDYPLVANVDDGAQVHVLGLGTITVGGP